MNELSGEFVVIKTPFKDRHGRIIKFVGGENMDVLKEKRLEKNMTLEDVGKLVGVGKSTVRKWENGMIENMGRDKIVSLSKALDISPLEILGMNEQEIPESNTPFKGLKNNEMTANNVNLYTSRRCFMTVGERMKARRKELCISADEVAKALEVSRSTIFRYEKGNIEKIPTSILEDVAKFLKTTPAYLMGWSNTNTDISSIYNQFDECNNDKQRNAIIAINIKNFIKEKKITQKKLAEEIGISPSTMSDYMNLRSNPSDGVIQKIADYFRVMKSDIDTTYKGLYADISPLYNQLDKTRKKRVYNFAEAQLQEQQRNKLTSINAKKTHKEEIAEK